MYYFLRGDALKPQLQCVCVCVWCYWFTEVLCCINNRCILPQHQHTAFERGLLHKSHTSSHLVACWNPQCNPNSSAPLGLGLERSQLNFNPRHTLCLRGRVCGFVEERCSQKWRGRRQIVLNSWQLPLQSLLSPRRCKAVKQLFCPLYI